MIDRMTPGSPVRSPAPANSAPPVVVRAGGAASLARQSSEPETLPHVPGWAMQWTGPGITRETVACDGVPGAMMDVAVRTGKDATLVSVTLEHQGEWTVESLDAAASEMVRRSFGRLRSSAHPEAVRLWNFLPGICAPMGDGLDRYRVFNIARHRAFASLFGERAIEKGTLPSASCVGHHGRCVSIHALGLATPARPIENPRQVPAFAYSAKFGPRPPCFARAGLVRFGGRGVLLVAGTASVRGEESVHAESLEEQCKETVANLRTVIAAGRGACAQVAKDEMGDREAEPFGRLRATRVYYRNSIDVDPLKRLLPKELLASTEVEFIHADICREELLVEIEVVTDVGRG
jgi:chorismate lyase / 3-hydroxybenzoate synthase